jgi:hypothetical protein
LSSIGVDLNEIWIFEENYCRLIHTRQVWFDGPVCSPRSSIFDFSIWADFSWRSFLRCCELVSKIS